MVGGTTAVPEEGLFVIDLVGGARPNFVKLAPVVKALRLAEGVEWRVVHTGQHYDPRLSEVFFRDLDIPEPDLHLDVGSGTHGAQTARILEGYEAHLLERRPDATVVFGDVNSTIACALAATKLDVPVAHVEAGLRSFDRSMPEEINRILTDAISDLLLVTEPAGVENLKHEGVADERIKLVGNTMIDTLLAFLPGARARARASDHGLVVGEYGVVTLHRPSNVDDPETLGRIIETLRSLARQCPLVFPIHPRTVAAARKAGIDLEPGTTHGGLHCLPPEPYVDHLSLMADARVVLTDSGGMQEECAVLGVPCITLRENTERPITLEIGASRLVGNDPERIRPAFEDALEGRWTVGEPVPLWDGRAGERVAAAVCEWLDAAR